MYLCVAGIYPYNSMIITWVSNNIIPEHKRAVAIPLFFSLANCAGFISSQIYPASDGPRFIAGNGVSLGVEVVSAVAAGLMILLCRRRNLQKKRLISEGVTDNGRIDDRGLDFVYIY